MIEFATASREFRSLVGRRRELLTLFGSIFAGLGIFLQNAWQGNLPDALQAVRQHLFAFHALLLAVPSVILALRMARIQAGLTLNGILITKLARDRGLAPGWTLANAARLNVLGVTFLQFALMDLLAGFAAAILAFALHQPGPIAVGSGMIVALGCLVGYWASHRQAVTFGMRKVNADAIGEVSADDWRGHLSGSLEDSNLDLNAIVGFVGLIVFSVFESLSVLGQIKPGAIDLAPALILRWGPILYVALMLTTCVGGMVANLRLRVAVGRLSLLLDPTDSPFRVGRVTDSLLAYLIVAFLGVVALHLLLVLTLPAGRLPFPTLVAIDAGALVVAILVEQATVYLAGRVGRSVSS